MKPINNSHFSDRRRKISLWGPHHNPTPPIATPTQFPINVKKKLMAPRDLQTEVIT